MMDDSEFTLCLVAAFSASFTLGLLIGRGII